MFHGTLGALVFILILVFAFPGYAGKMELSTYYPSPAGEYEQLQAGTLSTGTVQPAVDGHILLKPQTGNPSNWAAGRMGQFAYSVDQDALYHFNGSIWKKDVPPVRPLPKTD